MRWITDDWRMKLLALGLSVLMLGAVAFAQNPATQKTFSLNVGYTALPPNLIIINPQTKVAVNVTGLADTIGSLTVNSFVASVDAAKATTGPAVKLNISIKAVPGGVTVLNPVVPIVADIDTLASKALPVQVIARGAPGWAVTKAGATCPGSPKDACIVTFNGPLSWQNNLIAVVNYGPLVNVSSVTSENWPVQLQNSNGPLDLSLSQTTPRATLDQNTVEIDILATAGSTSSTIPFVDAAPSHGPPAGYRITGITISPATVIITGDPAVLGRTQRITLPAVDLSNATANTSFKVQIPYPAGVSPLGNVTTATITYQISKNPIVTPSP